LVTITWLFYLYLYLLYNIVLLIPSRNYNTNIQDHVGRLQGLPASPNEWFSPCSTFDLLKADRPRFSALCGSVPVTSISCAGRDVLTEWHAATFPKTNLECSRWPVLCCSIQLRHGDTRYPRLSRWDFWFSTLAEKVKVPAGNGYMQCDETTTSRPLSPCLRILREKKKKQKTIYILHKYELQSWIRGKCLPDWNR
jgi:hypothetical protein